MKSDLSLSARWLWLGVAALAIAGIFAIALVAARTPQLATLTQLFSVALVVHVDLSVLIWFLCIGGMGWSALIARAGKPWPYWQPAAFYLVLTATVLIALSPLSQPWDVIKSNYIPVLDNELFLLGLTLLAAGLCVVLLPLLVAYARPSVRRALSYVDLGWLYAGFITTLALAAFFLSGKTLPTDVPRAEQLEILFWAGGHLLQFAYCALMMASWLLLVKQITGKELKSFGVFIAYALLTAGAIASFAAFAFYPTDIDAQHAHHMRVMREGLGLGPIVMAALIILFLFAHEIKGRTAYLSALITSLLLFASGGVLGLMISGQNVTIPAHYHGSIVGVTLALMGAAYAMLPQFGYSSAAKSRMAFWQPIVYAAGQLMHIGGLAYSGGYGVLRKTPDAIETLSMNVKISMGIMGLGGLLAIIGGLMFVVVMGRAYMGKRRVAKR
jgi:cytochrome c oxidase subunit 1